VDDAGLERVCPGQSRPTALPYRIAGLLLVSVATLTLSGCLAGRFSASGVVSSDGGPLGHWSVPPDGCSVAPFDGLPVGKSSSVAQFLWQRRKAGWEKSDGDKPRWHRLPYLLDLSRGPDGLSGVLTLIPEDERVSLDHSVCRTLRLDSNPGLPAIPGGPASLDGRLVLDCMVNGSQVTADMRFKNCLL
jgi:hypothetical protein